MNAPDDADALTAALVFRVPRAARNRNPALHATSAASNARRRANRLRALVRQLGGAFGPVRGVSLEDEASVGDARSVVLRYELARVSFVRGARLSIAELAIVRVALARDGVRLVPAPLVARDDDRARVERLLAKVEELATRATRASAADHSP